MTTFASTTTTGLDFGDAPFPDQTMNVLSGAVHIIVPGYHLGAAIDADTNGQVSAAADGDDLDAEGDDEDGVIFLSAAIPGQALALRVSVSTGGYLQGWADFDQNASWDKANEQVFSNVYTTAGQHVMVFAIPASTQPSSLYLRFRFSTSADIGPRGLAEDGEVEDYLVTVVSAPVPTVTDRCTEWLQQADLLQGIDIESWLLQLSEVRREIRVADDWVADGRLVKAVRWWGSYLGWMGAADDVPQNVRPQGFRLTLYANLATNVSGDAYAQPGVELAHSVVSYASVSESLYSISDLPFVSSNAFEYEFEYYAELDQAWPVVDGESYWLGVEATYPSLIFSYRWGWCTAPVSEGYGASAVLQKRSPPIWAPMTYTPNTVSWRDITNHPSQGAAIDQAFEILTAACPAPEAQWAQAEDQVAAHALLSAYDSQQNVVLADDFTGDGRLVVQLDWRGAYPGWHSSVTGNTANPVLPPSGGEGPIGFVLTLMDEDGATCLPGLVKTSAFVSIAQCNELYRESAAQSWLGGHPVLQEYSYRLDLTDVTVPAEPWLIESGSNGWLSIQAVFDRHVVLTNHQGWAWQLAANNQICGSVRSVDGGVNWSSPTLSAPHPRQGQSFDLVFSLGTDEVTPGPPGNPPEILTIWTLNSDIVLESIGDGGIGSHVLQYATDLFENVWIDYIEDPLPLDVPLTNYWYFVPPPGSNLFFRIEQR